MSDESSSIYEPRLSELEQPSNRDSRHEISLNQNLNNLHEIASTHPCTRITHPSEILQYQPQQHREQHHRPYNRCKDIQAAADDKFERTGEGLTYWDLYRGSYKCVDTKKQAQDLLHNLKKRGFLRTKDIMTIPQEYFHTADQINLSISNNKKITYPRPTGVQCSQQDDSALTAAKAYDTASTMAIVTTGAIPSGMHKIHIHLDLNRVYASEAYHERLAHVPIRPSVADNNKGKLLSCRIQNQLVNCFISPHGAVDIYIRCSRKPLPIYIQDPDATRTYIIAFVSEVRQFLCGSSGLKDYSSKIVPPIQNWRLVRADINFDVPCTTNKFQITANMQITKFGDVFRIYAKMLEGKTHIRLEQDNVFNAPLSGTNENNNNQNLGHTIVSAAKSLARKLLTHAAGDPIAMSAVSSFLEEAA